MMIGQFTTIPVEPNASPPGPVMNPRRTNSRSWNSSIYVVKPFSPRELAARVRSVLRRAHPPTDVPRLDFNGLSIDGQARTVTLRGEPVSFRAREFDLLFLPMSPCRVFSRGQLLNHVWDHRRSSATMRR